MLDNNNNFIDYKNGKQKLVSLNANCESIYLMEVFLFSVKNIINLYVLLL